MLKIGLTQRVHELEDAGERRDCLDQEWTRLLGALGLAVVAIPNQLPDIVAFVDACGLQGLILTGGNDLAHLIGSRSPAPERDATERALLSLASHRRLPVLGVCRGMQMMVSEGGGTLRRTPGHVAVRHRLVICAGSTMPLGPRDEVNSFHDYGVPGDGLGPNWRAEAAAPDGSLEAAVHRHLPQWAVMWHPERLPFDPRDAELIRARFVGGA